MHKHLELPNTTDFSSSFNTMLPHILAEKLSTLPNLDDQLTQWINDFLTNRTERVLVENIFSDLYRTSTGSPQGCKHLSLLFILYTNDCRATHPLSPGEVSLTQFSCLCSPTQ